jgi:hypothetical protein
MKNISCSYICKTYLLFSDKKMSDNETNDDEISSSDDRNDGTCVCGLFHHLPPEIW